MTQKRICKNLEFSKYNGLGKIGYNLFFLFSPKGHHDNDQGSDGAHRVEELSHKDAYIFIESIFCRKRSSLLYLRQRHQGAGQAGADVGTHHHRDRHLDVQN